MPGKRLDNPPSPKTLPGTRISANRVPSGRGDRGSRGKPKVQTPTSGTLAAPVLSGWEHNGHVFEKDLVCKCRKTLAQHNKDPWACPLAVKKLETAVEALRKAMSSKIAGLKRELQALHQPI